MTNITKNFGSMKCFVGQNRVYSYDTHVGTIVGGKLIVNKEFHKFSPTTTRHLSRIRQEFGLSELVVNVGSYLHTMLFVNLAI